MFSNSGQPSAVILAKAGIQRNVFRIIFHYIAPAKAGIHRIHPYPSLRGAKQRSNPIKVREFTFTIFECFRRTNTTSYRRKPVPSFDISGSFFLISYLRRLASRLRFLTFPRRSMGTSNPQRTTVRCHARSDRGSRDR